MESKKNKGLKTIDASSMAEHLFGLPDHMKDAVRLYAEAPCSYSGEDVRNVVITGMGGSAIGGDLLRCVVERDIQVPLSVVRGYRLPAFVSGGTLLMGVSHSGNTEETLSTFRQGLDRGAKGYAITSGGKLGGIAEEFSIPCVSIPAGMPPRCALGYLFVPPLLALAGAGLIPNKDMDLNEAVGVLMELRETYGPQSPLEENPAKKLAIELLDMAPIIYGSTGGTEAVALRWKTQLNENAKTYAAYNVIPEMNHNEIAGWDAQPELSARTIAVFLRDDDDHPSVNKRIDFTKPILKEKGLTVREFQSFGRSLLARLFSLIYFGDYVSYYLAILYEIDPTPVKVIEELKWKLEQE